MSEMNTNEILIKLLESNARVESDIKNLRETIKASDSNNKERLDDVGKRVDKLEEISNKVMLKVMLIAAFISTTGGAGAAKIFGGN